MENLFKDGATVVYPDGRKDVKKNVIHAINSALKHNAISIIYRGRVFQAVGDRDSIKNEIIKCFVK